MTADGGSVRVRFAPSPTGHLHVGGARTAIFNWLYARHRKGTFILRVEDTDQERSTLESEGMVVQDLRWLGLDWDEGPDIGGPYGPYRQSERRDVYAAAAARLIERRAAYRCFCSEAELEARRAEAEAEGRAPHYDQRCFLLASHEVQARIDRGDPFVIRFHVPGGGGSSAGDVEIRDLIRGSVSWKKETLGDFILVRSDGMPTYNFSVVVDDHAMAISHVIRAEEHLTNTHRQVLIFHAFGWALPEFAHVSLILGQDRSKLSKRHGATSVAAYRERGFLPEATLNYLTLLGWSSAEEREFFTRDYAIERFSLDRVNAAPAIFDEMKFTWVNGQHIHHSSAGELYRFIEDPLRQEGWLRAANENAETRVWFEDAIEAVKKKVHRLDEFTGQLKVFFSYEPEVAVKAHAEALGDEKVKGLLRALLQELRTGGSPLTQDEYKAFTERLAAASGLKTKQLYMPIRIALTGSDHGPDLQRLFALLERGSSLDGLPTVEAPVSRIERFLRLAES